jgi:hypothetical protein
MCGWNIRERVRGSSISKGTEIQAEGSSLIGEYEDLDVGGGYDDTELSSVHEISVFVDEMEDLLCSAAKVPLTSKALVDQEQCLATLDVLRANWPLEVLRAQRVLAKEGKVLEQAELEAERTRQRAEREAALIIDQNQLVKMAEVRAQEIIEAAEQEAEQTRRRAEQDARDVYQGLERELDFLTRDIKELVAARVGRLRR